MIPIETATPEQVCDCVLGLKRHIDRLEAENRRYCKALERIHDTVTDYQLRYTEARNQVMALAQDALEGWKDE